MPINEIVIKGAREHNLKNVDVTMPRDKPTDKDVMLSRCHLMRECFWVKWISLMLTA